MKIYRVVETDGMGWGKEHGFYLDEKEAIKKYREIARKFQKENQSDISFCEHDDIEKFRKPYSDKLKYIRYIRIPYYYRCSYEYQEYDETIIEFYVEEFEVK